jgi:RTX calcium-binding nonapeptide repeat (4 copies)/WD40-like Beta Propeller Repeat
MEAVQSRGILRTLVGALAGVLAVGSGLLVSPGATASDFGGNGMIVFSSSGGPHDSDVWVANPDGTGARDISADKPGSHSEPTWSPEGGPHIAFVTSSPGHPGDIWWSTPAGVNLTKVTDTPDLDERSPSFSPGGGHIVYSRAPWNKGRSGPSHIYESHLMGGPAHQFTSGSSDDITPSWSPDTFWIAYASDRGGSSDYGIWQMLSQTGDSPPRAPARRITAFGTSPQWAPDNAGIVFEDPATGSIWKVSRTREGDPAQQRLPEWGAPVQLTQGPSDSNPQWEPYQPKHGGGHIVFQRGTRTWIMNANGRYQHPLGKLPAVSIHPDIQPVCTVPGTDGNDVQVGTDGRDLICWSQGNDVAYGKGGDDVMFGGPGRGTLYGGDGADLIQGGGGNATVGDTIYGGAGNDFLTGSPKDDAIYGGPGQDRMIGETGDDRLVDEADNGTDHDTLFGGPGNDTCIGDRNDYFGGCETIILQPIN